MSKLGLFSEDKESKEFRFEEFDKTFSRIIPYERKSRTVVNLSDFVLQKDLVSGIHYPFINALQMLSKTISVEMGRMNHQRNQTSENGETYKMAKTLENLAINILGDTGLISYIISPFTEEVMKIQCRYPGDHVMCINVIDSLKNVEDNLPFGTFFALYKYEEKDGLEIHELTGDKIVTAGMAVYGTCSILVLGFLNKGLHGFILDESLGEYTIVGSYSHMPPRGIALAINEGITCGWDEATKIYTNRRKDPRHFQACQTFYMGSLAADLARILKSGGLIMYPPNIKHPEGKLRLLYECNPVAFMVKEAGGYTTDGFISTLHIEPKQVHQRVPFFAGSLEDVLDFMELKTIYKARDIQLK